MSKGHISVDRDERNKIVSRADNDNVVAEFIDGASKRYFVDIREWLLRGRKPWTADHYRTLSRWAETVADYLDGKKPEGDDD